MIKQHLPDTPLMKALLTPEDWKLLRYCPCPVLIVKTARPWTGGTSDVLVLKPDDIITHLEELAAPSPSTSADTAASSWPYNHHNHRPHT